MKFFANIFAAFFFAANCFYAQSADSLSLKQIIDEYVATIAAEEESSAAEDFLENLAENKIDINSADYIELSRIPFFGYDAISKIIAYRERHGKFESLDELADAGIPKRVRLRVTPFLTLGKRTNGATAPERFAANLRMRGISTERAFSDFEFYRAKTYARLTTNMNGKFFFNAIVEKDAYERRLADYRAANLVYRSDSFARNLILGAFSVQFGQGLVSWSPYAFSKNSDIKSAIKKGEILIPHKSAEENRFLNGAALEMRTGKFSATVFYSDKKYDASIKNGGFSALSESGLHITENDFLRDGNLKITAFGGALAYKNENSRFAFFFMQNNFSRNFIPETEANNYGKRATFFSAEAKYHFKKIFFAGEIAFGKKGNAQFYSVQFRPARNFFILTSYRFYSREYFSPWARGFGEYGKTNNEKGFFTGAVFLSPFGRISFYYDIFSAPAPDSRFPFPVSGKDFTVDFISKKISNTKIQLRIKNETKENYALLDDAETESLVKISVLRARALFVTRISRSFVLKTQIDYAGFASVREKSAGYAFSETCVYKYEAFSFVFSASMFDTEDYRSRIYVYEYDLDGVFTNRAYYGKSYRYYFLLKWKVLKNLNVNLKLRRVTEEEPAHIDETTNFPVTTISIQFEYAPRFEF